MQELIKFESEELSLMEKPEADKIVKALAPMAKMLEELNTQFDQIVKGSEKEITEDITKEAKTLRLAIGKVRIRTEEWRKKAKEESLRRGKAIDGVSNILKDAVISKENKLKEIENYFEEKERKRLMDLQFKRGDLINKYIIPEEVIDFATMPEDVWEAYYQAKKKAYEDRLEAEKKAEEERKQNEAIEKLRWKRSDEIKPYYNFFEEKEGLHLGKLNEDEFSLIMSDLKNKKLKHDAEQEEIRKENDQLKKEAEERDRIENERLDKEEKERIASEEEIKKEREEKERLEQAPDYEKMRHFMYYNFEILGFPEFTTDRYKKLAEKIKKDIKDLCDYVKKTI